MHIKVNYKCIGCGTCVIICDAFKIGKKGISEFDEKKACTPEQIKKAISACPVGAIEEEQK